MTPQEIAQAISKTDWIAAEGDDASIWDELHYLREQLCSYQPNEIVQILYQVMKARACAEKFPDSLRDMLEFKYLNDKFKTPTSLTATSALEALRNILNTQEDFVNTPTGKEYMRRIIQDVLEPC